MHSLVLLWIIPHHEVVVIPVACIVADEGRGHILEVVLDVDVELPVVFIGNAPLRNLLLSPTLSVTVTPSPVELFFTPWVS